VAVARFVLRNREHLALLKPDGPVVTLIQMRFADELRSPDELNLPEARLASPKELSLATKLVDQLTEAWQPEDFHDTYIEDLKRIIQDKVEGREVEVEEEEPAPIEVTDLFARLSQSLEQAKARREPAEAAARDGKGDHKDGKTAHKTSRKRK
jgi:DNA end-binding protein Ku